MEWKKLSLVIDGGKTARNLTFAHTRLRPTTDAQRAQLQTFNSDSTWSRELPEEVMGQWRPPIFGHLTV